MEKINKLFIGKMVMAQNNVGCEKLEKWGWNGAFQAPNLQIEQLNISRFNQLTSLIIKFNQNSAKIAKNVFIFTSYKTWVL